MNSLKQNQILHFTLIQIRLQKCTTILNLLHFTIQQNKIAFAGGTKADDSENGNLKLFYDALNSTEDFKIEKNELMIYYNTNRKYLLWKQ